MTHDRTANKEGTKLQQAEYWLAKALEYEARYLEDKTGVATTKMTDMAFHAALKAEREYFATHG